MNKKGDLRKRPPTDKRTRVDDAEGDECQRPELCIFCGGPRIWWVGYHERTASVLEGDEVVHLVNLLARRARCAACRVSWIVRSLKLFPYRHFQLEVVAEAVARYLFCAEATLVSVATWARCAQRTLRRWVEWMGRVSTPAELVARLTELAGQPVRLKALPVAEEIRKSRTPERRTLLRDAAWNLALLEAMCAALGFEPPGLKSVLARVVGDRPAVTTYARPVLPELARSLIWRGSATMTM
jgi:hypothetical protein